MREEVFGRTNRIFPKIWLALSVPSRQASGETMEQYVAEALKLNIPIDISVAPALFGGFLPSNSDAILLTNSSLDVERSTDSKHAADLIQAHLIETLSSIGRPYIDFYFLRSRTAFEESQISGILEAMELARQEGHIRFLGLRVENFAASVGNWQFHDAFDTVSAPSNFPEDDLQTVKRMAMSRRAGFLLRTPLAELSSRANETALVNVNSFRDLEAVSTAS